MGLVPCDTRALSGVPDSTLDLFKRSLFTITKHNSISETRIAERRFLTGLPRGYFFCGEGAAIHTQATIKPCRRPLRETE